MVEAAMFPATIVLEDISSVVIVPAAISDAVIVFPAISFAVMVSLIISVADIEFAVILSLFIVGGFPNAWNEAYQVSSEQFFATATSILPLPTALAWELDVCNAVVDVFVSK